MTLKEFRHDASITFLNDVLEEHKAICDAVYAEVVKAIEREEYNVAAGAIQMIKNSTQELAEDVLGIDLDDKES